MNDFNKLIGEDKPTLVDFFDMVRPLPHAGSYS